VDTAALRLEEEGVGGMLVLPGDIPAVRPADIARILRTHSGAVAVTLVEAARDGGTNALAVSPPGVIPFRYGEKSAAAHRYEALCRGIAPGMLDLPRVSLDLDNPDDLQRFLALGVTTRTSGLLKSFRLRKETK
jgi:2-phospho-L-lactate guanylyltransferase